MDLNYNIIKLEEIIENLVKETIEQKGKNSAKKLIDAIINEHPLEIEEEKKSILSNYSSDTLRLVIEKKVLLSIENSALANRKSYWDVLKSRAPRIKSGIMSHYYDNYINDLANENIKTYEARTINELIETYDSEIKENINNLSNDINAIVDTMSSITLDHMENVNSNGRILSVNGKRKGGIFLAKNSKISYGKFVNKDEFLIMLETLKKLPNSENFVTKSGEISVSELKVIVESVNSCLNLEQNEKLNRSDARTVSVGEAGLKSAGNVFLGKGTELPNGSYVSMEEINLAITKYINEKNQPKIEKKPMKVMAIKGKIKQFATVAAMAVTMLTATIPSMKKNIFAQTRSVTQEVENNSNEYESSNEIFVESAISTAQSDIIVENKIIENPLEIEQVSEPQIEVINTISEPQIEVINTISESNNNDFTVVEDSISEDVNEQTTVNEESTVAEAIEQNSELEQVNDPISDSISDQTSENGNVDGVVDEIISDSNEDKVVENSINENEDEVVENSINENETVSTQENVQEEKFNYTVETYQEKSYDVDYATKLYLYAIAQHEAGGHAKDNNHTGDERMTDANGVACSIINRSESSEWINWCHANGITDPNELLLKMLFYPNQYMSRSDIEGLAYYKNPDLLLPEVVQGVDDSLAGIRTHLLTSYRGVGHEADDRLKLVPGGNNYFGAIVPIVEEAKEPENTLYMSDAELISYEAMKESVVDSNVGKVR